MSIMRRLMQWAQGDEAEVAARAADPPALRLLMVCTGNICRSPIAEGVLRAKLAQAGLSQGVLVDSAGTHGYHTGEPPDPRAIRLAALRGYSIAGLRARPVVPADFESFHWLLALDEGHRCWLAQRVPTASTVRVERLMDHASRHPGITEVPDPYYGPDAGFEQVLDLVEDACDGLVARLQTGAAGKA